MSLPVFLHSNMVGAPSLTAANGSINALLNACLVNGFNTQSVVSATAAGGVVTFNFASAPGFSALDSVTLAGASNAAVNGRFRVQSAASNQVLVAIPGVPDGAVGGTIAMKFSPLGWTRPFSGTNMGAYRQGGSNSTKRYLRVYDGTITTEQVFYLRGYEAMTAISTGTGPFPTTSQFAGNGVGHYAPVGAATGNKPWAVIGTPRAFYLLNASYSTYDAGALLTVGDTFQAFFGDPARVQKINDPYACVVSASTSFPGAGNPLYIARSHTSAAGALIASLVSPTASGGYLSVGAAFPDPATGGITLGDSFGVVQTEGAATLRGFMPGLLSCWQDIASNEAVLRPCVPFSDVPGVAGRMVMTCTTGYPRAGAVLALDEDWGDT